MANPQDYRLSYTRSGMPVLEGKSGQSVRELSAEQARKRLNELIYEEGRESASSRPAPRPRTRPQLPATPAVSATALKPLQPISDTVSQTLGTLAQRMPQRAIGSLPSLQRSPAASLLLQQTGLTEPKRPAKVAVPEEEVEKALEGVEDADRLTEDARRAQYLSRTPSPPQGWNPTPAETKSLLDEGLLTQQDLRGPDRLQLLWDALRAQQQEPLMLANRFRGLSEVQQQALAPSEQKARERLFKRGLSFSEMGSKIDWYRSRETLRREYYTLLNQERVEEGKGLIEGASPEEQEKFREDVQFRADLTLQSIAASSGLSVSNVNNPKIQENIESYWALFQPFRALFSPATFFEPSATGGLAVSPEEAIFNVGEARYIPQAQEAYGNLQKFAMLASVGMVPLAAMMESGEGWNDRQTLAVLREGRADPFDHLDKFGYLLTGDEDNRFNKVLGTTLLTAGLLLEPEPFTTILSLPAAARKAFTYATRKNFLGSFRRSIGRELPKGREGRLTPGQFLENIEEAGEVAGANLLRHLGQQALGVRGRSFSAFGRFERQIENLQSRAADAQRKVVELSGETASASQQAALRQARLEVVEAQANVAYLEMQAERALLNAALGLRGFSAEDAAKVVDPKSAKAKYTANTRAVDLARKQSKASEEAANKAQKEYDAARATLKRENQQLGRILQDILGAEVPAAGRTATGRVSARWYPLVTTDSAGAIQIANSVPTVTGDDIVAVWDNAAGKWVDPVGINPNRVYGGKRGGPLQIENVSVGVASQRKRPAGSISLPETSNRKYDLWFDVVDSTGNRFRVRHPVSRSSWGRRPDARKLASEGFGIDIRQAQALDNAARLRAQKLEDFRPISAAYDEAIATRKAYATLLDEVETGTAVTSRITAWRNSKNRFESLEKSRKEAQKLAGKAGRAEKSAAAKLRNGLVKFAEKEVDVASAGAQREVVFNIAEKMEEGLGQLEKLLKQRTGGIIGAAFTRSLNDIIDYKNLRPDEIRDAVKRIVTKSIKDTKDGAGIIRPGNFKARLELQYMKAPNATRETAERAIDILANRSPVAKKVLDAAEEGKPLPLTADEIAELQVATGEWITKSWKNRLSQGPLGYARVFEKEKEYYYKNIAKISLRKWFTNYGLKRTKDSITAARAIKARQLGVTDDEMADVYIATGNMYDLAMDELLAVTNFGKMGEENATENMIKLMDNEEKLVLRSSGTSKVSKALGLETKQTQQFESLLGLDSRFIGAKASLLDDLRVVPMAGLNEKAFYNKRKEIADSLEMSVEEVDPALVHRAMDENQSDEFVQAIKSAAYAFYPAGLNTERGTGNALVYEAMRILRGTRQADGSFKGGAKTFREFAARMGDATKRITGENPDLSARAYAMAATGFTGAAVSGYGKQLAARVNFAPLSPDQAMAINRILLGNPQSKVDATKSGTAAFALTEKQIDEGIEALAELGLVVGERATTQVLAKGGKLKAELSDVLKELVKVGSDPSTNPYVIRGLLRRFDELSQGPTKQLIAYAGIKPDVLTAEGFVMRANNGLGFLNSTWRTSLTTGLFYPNPSYWANNVMGDFSQMWFEVGLTRAARLSFNNFANNIPGWGRGLAERQAQMQAWALKKGADALPSPLEVAVNPYLGKLLKGEDFTVVAKDGTRIRGRDLMREAIEDGIYATQVNQELFTVFKRELGKHEWAKSLGGDTRMAQLIADHANLVQQRQRMALYADFRMQGLSRIEARRRTLDALYDWKDGVSAFEINTFVRLAPFYRFWRLGLRQMAGAILEPLTKPVTSQLVKSLRGQTKIARTKQQVMLFGGMPEIFGYDNMMDAE